MLMICINGFKVGFISSIKLFAVMLQAFDLIDIFLCCNSEITVTLLFIENKIDFVPYTTKCSPANIILPGTDAIDFN